MPVPPPPPAIAAHFPYTVAKDLNGRTVALPRDLPGEKSVVLIAWQREQQTDIDTWIRGLKLGSGTIPWVELPVIEKLSPFTRWFIDRGMRNGIEDREAWSHVITLYLDKAAFNTKLGISEESAVQILVVDRAGHVVERVVGDYTETSAAKLKNALKP